MANFASDTELVGDNGRYHAKISPEWKVWGPLGGYIAAIAVRAMGRETELRRPASISCQFLAFAEFADVDVEVSTLRRGKRSHALHVRLLQKGEPVLAATGWVVDEGMTGLEHEHGEMPPVPLPHELKSYSELSDNFDDWYPVWHGALDGKPTEWRLDDQPGLPIWRTWMRVCEPFPRDPFLDAARSLMWMDIMMWNAATGPHTWPVSHIAPNLDVSAIFHASAYDDEWLLCDCYAPVGREGIVGCSGRVWSPSGKLIASGNSCLFCKPNPEYKK